MVEKAKPCVNVTPPRTVQIQPNGNLRFVGVALNFRHPGRIAQEMIDGLPAGGGKGRAGVGLLSQGKPRIAAPYFQLVLDRYVSQVDKPNLEMFRSPVKYTNGGDFSAGNAFKADTVRVSSLSNVFCFVRSVYSRSKFSPEYMLMS